MSANALLMKHIMRERTRGVPLNKLYHYFKDYKILCECDECQVIVPFMPYYTDNKGINHPIKGKLRDDEMYCDYNTIKY